MKERVREIKSIREDKDKILDWIKWERISIRELRLEDDDRYQGMYVERYVGCLDDMEDSLNRYDELSKDELEDLKMDLVNIYCYREK